MIGRIGNAGNPGHAFDQRALDAATQRGIDHAASVTAAAELKHDDALARHLAQADASVVLSELRIDFRFDHVTHALDDAGVFARR